MQVVFGATGPVGRAVVEELVARGEPVTAVTRDPGRAAGVLPAGTRVLRADVDEPASVRAAVRGACGVLVLSPHAPEQARQQSGIVRAAVEAGAARIVKLSALPAAVTADSPSDVGRAHWATEQELTATGSAWTIVRPTPFLQNLPSLLAASATSSRLRLPMGSAPVALVDARDVGAVLAAALAEPGHDGQCYAVTGPRGVTFGEVADVLSTVRSTPLRYTPVPPRLAATVQRARGVDGWLVRHQTALARLVSAGAASTVSDVVQRVLGRPARTLEAYVQEHREQLSA